MNIARIKYDQQIYYAAIDTEKDCATLIDGDIFGREIVLTNTSLPLDDCTLLAPVKPPHVYAIGLNYAAHVMSLSTLTQRAPIQTIRSLFSVRRRRSPGQIRRS